MLLILDFRIFVARRSFLLGLPSLFKSFLEGCGNLDIAMKGKTEKKKNSSRKKCLTCDDKARPTQHCDCFISGNGSLQELNGSLHVVLKAVLSYYRRFNGSSYTDTALHSSILYYNGSYTII